MNVFKYHTYYAVAESADEARAMIASTLGLNQNRISTDEVIQLSSYTDLSIADDDGAIVSRTCGEWASTRGSGYLASIIIDELDYTLEDQIVCPECGHEHEPEGDDFDEGDREKDCENCEATFTFSTQVDIKFSSTPKRGSRD